MATVMAASAIRLPSGHEIRESLTTDLNESSIHERIFEADMPAESPPRGDGELPTRTSDEFLLSAIEESCLMNDYRSSHSARASQPRDSSVSEAHRESEASPRARTANIVIDQQRLLQHLHFTVDHYGRNPVLAPPEASSARLSPTRTPLHTRRHLTLAAARPQSRPASVEQSPWSPGAGAGALFDATELVEPCVSPIASIPGDSPLARHEMESRLQPRIETLPEAEQLPAIEDTFSSMNMSMRRRQKDATRAELQRQREASLQASRSLFDAGRAVHATYVHQQQAKSMRDRQHHVVRSRSDEYATTELLGQARQDRAAALRAFKQQQQYIVKGVKDQRAASAAARIVHTQAERQQRTLALEEREEYTKKLAAVRAGENRELKEDLRSKFAKQREEVAAAAAAHYASERQQRYEERAAMLLYLRYQRITNQHHSLAQKQFFNRLAHDKARLRFEEQAAKAAAVRETTLATAPLPLAATLYASPGLNVTHEPRPLPGYALPERMLEQASAQQRYEALLVSLETKWRWIGDFCDREKCRLNPRDACECCFQKFQTFSTTQLDRSGIRDVTI